MGLTFSVAVVTVEGPVFNGPADFVQAPGADGDLGILAHHIPLLTPLRLGELLIRLEDDETYLFLAGGFLAVLPGRVVVLADVVERAEAIDVERAAEARRRATEALAQGQPSRETAEALERALLRLKVADIARNRRSKPRRPHPLQ